MEWGKFFSDFKTGVSCVCPRCKSGPIFKPGISVEVRDTCENCGFPLSKNDSADGPAVFLIFILGFSIIPLALFVEYIWGWPTIVHVIVWSFAILGLTIGLLRPIKSYVIFLQYQHLPDSMDDE